MNAEELIRILAQDATPPWRFRRVLAWAVLGGALISALVFFAAIGVRPDIGEAMETMRFPFKFVVTLALAIAATGLVSRLARPDARPGRWRWALAIAPALLVLAVIAELSAMPPASWGPRLVGTNARFCVTLIPLLAIGPLACLIFALRQGAPSRPGLTGAVAGLAASGIAATFYASHCTDDSPLFVATWYPIATAIVVLAGYMAGRRLLRW